MQSPDHPLVDERDALDVVDLGNQTGDVEGEANTLRGLFSLYVSVMTGDMTTIGRSSSS